jgi:hypothetical protein
MLKIPNFDVTLFEKKSMAIKYFFCDIKQPQNDLLLLKTKVQLAHQYLFMASNTLDHVAQQGHGQRKN